MLAADAGYLACRQAGITPDLLLGDVDSMDQPADFDHVRRVPVEKDDTDTMLAVKTGLEQGCGEFYIYGGTGGRRLDHTLANLQTLLYLRRHGARGYLYDNDFVWTAVENETITVEQTVEWGLLSVFCLVHRPPALTRRCAVSLSTPPFRRSSPWASATTSSSPRPGSPSGRAP
ncbi:MAG: thiamine diphosphokinase [Dysosmobacter welbionis]